MPATGLHGQLVHAGVLPCAALAVLLALAGSALYADRLERGFDARGHALAEQLALGLSLSGDGAAPHDRKSGVEGQSGSVGVDLGGRRLINKKNTFKSNT